MRLRFSEGETGKCAYGIFFCLRLADVTWVPRIERPKGRSVHQWAFPQKNGLKMNLCNFKY